MDTKTIPLRAIKDAVIKSLPIGLSKTSTNGREFRSHDFVRYKRKYRLAEKMSRRSYAKVVVLGDLIEAELDVNRWHRELSCVDHALA